MVVGEDGNFRPQEDRLLSEAEEVADRLTPEAVKQMAVLLITYLAGEVPIEKWQELEPRRTVLYAKRVLKARDDAVAQAVENCRAGLDRSHEKGRRLAQEVLIAQDGQRAAEEMEQYALEAEKFAKREVDELTQLLEEDNQRIAELNAELASVTQEMENYRTQASKAKLDLDAMRFQNSEHGRRSTLLRNNDEVTVGGVLQSLKERHVRYTAMQQKFGTALDFLAGKAEQDGENNWTKW